MSRKLDWKILGLIGIVVLALIAALVISNQDQFAGIFGAGGGKEKAKKEEKKEEEKKEESKGEEKKEESKGEEKKEEGKKEEGQPPAGGQPPTEGQPPAGGQPPADETTKGQPGAAWTRKGLDDTKQNQNQYTAGQDTLSYHTANMPPGDYTIIVHRPGKHGEVMLTVPVTVGADGSLNYDLGVIPPDWKGEFQVQISSNGRLYSR